MIVLALTRMTLRGWLGHWFRCWMHTRRVEDWTRQQVMCGEGLDLYMTARSVR